RCDESFVPAEETGRVQLSACAVESAARRLPTPSGPANIRLGGSASRSTDRARRPTTRRCPTMSRNGMKSFRESYHYPPFFGFTSLLLPASSRPRPNTLDQNPRFFGAGGGGGSSTRAPDATGGGVGAGAVSAANSSTLVGRLECT